MADQAYRTALIVGVGSGLSASIARGFAKAGMKVALAARRAAELAPLAKEVGGRAFACDATKHADVAKLFADVEAAFGAPDVVVFNAGYRTRGPFVELDPAEVEKTLIASAFAGFLVAQEAAKRMLPHKHGAILFTGASASVKGYAQSAPFAMGKFALRGLAQSMARELAPQGIHVAHVVDRRRHPQRQPRGATRPARQHARSGRDRADLSGPLAATSQRLGLGNRTAALGRAILKPAATLRYNQAMEILAKAARRRAGSGHCRNQRARASLASKTRAAPRTGAGGPHRTDR